MRLRNWKIGKVEAKLAWESQCKGVVLRWLFSSDLIHFSTYG